MRLLVVDDDALVANVLTKILADQNYAVESATDGEEGWSLIETYDYDLILLDVMLPRLDGISLCRRLRSRNIQTPVLLLTGRDSGHDKAVGLDAGADDYVVKPFDAEELVARVRALLRRGGATTLPVLEWGELRLDPTTCIVTWQGTTLPLTSKEYALLELFLRNNRRVFSCSSILEHLWSYETTPSEEAVRTHIKCLRQKFKTNGAPSDLIETVYGIGYRLKPLEPAASPGVSPEVAAPIASDECPPSPQQTLAAIAKVWERFKERISEQVSILEQAVHQSPTASDPDLWQQARREAHTLAGSLGTFGFATGSQVARKIEQLLKPNVAPPARTITQLQTMVSTLRQEISHPPHLTPTRSEASPTHPAIAPVAAPSDLNGTAPLLLVVDRDRSFMEQLIKEAVIWGLHVETATDLKTAWHVIHHHHPQVVLLDPTFSERSEDGTSLLVELGRQTPPIPALVFSARTGLEERLEMARRGGRVFLPKPISTTQALEAVMQVVNANSIDSEARILAVDDDPSILMALKTLLEPWGLHLTPLADPRDFWNVLESSAPDLLILDVEMPYLNGVELCQIVRNDLRWSSLPILFLTAHTNAEVVNQVFSAGADDFISKPILGPEVINRIMNRLERVKLLRSLSETDPLTRLSNRQKSTQDIAKLLHLSQRHNKSLCLTVLDLDHFKQINDRYGHAIGDEILRRFSQLLRQNFRREDVIARWGGEEFVVVMYGTSRHDAISRVTRLLQRLRTLELLSIENEPISICFSAGVAQYPDDGLDLQTLYCNADAALYRAKMSGRDRVLAAEVPGKLGSIRTP